MGLLLVAQTVLPDEPCFSLSELNLLRDNGHTWQRCQVLLVVRADRLARYEIEMGPREQFLADPFRLLGGFMEDGKIYIFHSVAELQHIAHYMREEPPQRLVKESTPFVKAAEDVQRAWDWQHRLVFSGPAGTRGKDGVY